MSINNKFTTGKAKPRPVFLNLFVIRLPVSALVSILHRISGVLMILLIPAAIYSFGLSLEGPDQFAKILGWIDSAAGTLALLFLLTIFAQHFFSGLRHLAMDIDWGVDKHTAHLSGWGTLLATFLVIGVVIFWLAK